LISVPEDVVPHYEVLAAVSRHLEDPTIASVVVDLSRVPALDLEGVAALVQLKRRGVAARKRLMLGGISEPARRKLQLTGVLDWLAREDVA
jgi:anti-anti-sigma regulatory factor